MAKVVLGPHAGGIGDNMLYSNLPEQYAAQGLEVWIGQGGPHPAPRNPESYELIWGRNPHVAGFTTDPPTVGVCTIVNDFIGEAKRMRNQFLAIDKLHGFEPIHTVPKLYYQPTIREEYREHIFVSPTAISTPVPECVVEEFVHEVARWHLFDPNSVIVLLSQHDGQWGKNTLRANQKMMVKDIYEWVDIIASCKLFLSTESGASAVAAALRPPWTSHAVCSLWTFNDKIWLYDGVTYRASGKIPLHGDYHPYPPQNRPVGQWGEVAV